MIYSNGSHWGNWAHDEVYIINTESGNIEHTLDLPWKTFAEASLYYKNSLYSFGGGDSLPDGALSETRTVKQILQDNFSRFAMQPWYLFK